MRARAATPLRVDVSDLGMWVFLTTETLFFGALFFAYTVGRLKYAEAFAAAGKHTDLVLGTLNTAILLTSSLFMALALEKTNRGMRHAGARLLELDGDVRGCLPRDQGNRILDRLRPTISFRGSISRSTRATCPVRSSSSRCTSS